MWFSGKGHTPFPPRYAEKKVTSLNTGVSGRTQVQGKSSNLYAQSTYSTYIWIFQYISDEKHHEKDVSCRCNN